jgi:hypothetical protein
MEISRVLVGGVIYVKENYANKKLLTSILDSGFEMETKSAIFVDALLANIGS